MMISTSNYADFKTVVTNLTPLLTAPEVFHFTTPEGLWIVWAILQDTVVTTNSQEGQPANFTADFPGRIQVTGILTVR